MDKSSKILIIGHNDIVENSLYDYLLDKGYQQTFSASRLSVNPTIQPTIYDFFQTHKPDYIFLGSTLSGGIQVNLDRPADFIYHNLQSACNVFYAARKFDTKKIIYLASSCVYPKECPQPMSEDHILTGSLEKSSEPYSVAKIAGIQLALSFGKQYDLNTVVMIPATLYGPGFDKDLNSTHVIGALIHKFIHAIKEGKDEVAVWGSGKPRREFLYIDDFIDALLLLVDKCDEREVLNAGSGSDVTIDELARLIAELCGFKGRILYDESKPDGVMQKLLDNARIKDLGWEAKTSLREGLVNTINSYKSEVGI